MQHWMRLKRVLQLLTIENIFSPDLEKVSWVYVKLDVEKFLLMGVLLQESLFRVILMFVGILWELTFQNSILFSLIFLIAGKNRKSTSGENSFRPVVLQTAGTSFLISSKSISTPEILKELSLYAFQRIDGERDYYDNE